MKTGADHFISRSFTLIRTFPPTASGWTPDVLPGALIAPITKQTVVKGIIGVLKHGINRFHCFLVAFLQGQLVVS